MEAVKGLGVLAKHWVLMAHFEPRGACCKEVDVKLDRRIGIMNAIFDEGSSFATLARYSGFSRRLTTPSTPISATGKALAIHSLLLATVLLQLSPLLPCNTAAPRFGA